MSRGGHRGRAFAPPPGGADVLAAMPVHRIVMAWPETFEVFARRGVLPGSAGGRPPVSRDRAELTEALLAATAWRPPSGRGDREEPGPPAADRS